MFRKPGLKRSPKHSNLTTVENLTLSQLASLPPTLTDCVAPLLKKANQIEDQQDNKFKRHLKMSKSNKVWDAPRPLTDSVKTILTEAREITQKEANALLADDQSQPRHKMSR